MLYESQDVRIRPRSKGFQSERGPREEQEGRIYASPICVHDEDACRFMPFKPQSGSFGSYSREREKEREIDRHFGTETVSFRIMGLIVRYLPRRETLCTDFRILRICSKVARWGRIRWCRRTTSILRNALITAWSKLDHGSRSAVLNVFVRLMHLNSTRALRHVLMDSRHVSACHCPACYRSSL